MNILFIKIWMIYFTSMKIILLRAKQKAMVSMLRKKDRISNVSHPIDPKMHEFGSKLSYTCTMKYVLHKI